jgi:hypothetical protein
MTRPPESLREAKIRYQQWRDFVYGSVTEEFADLGLEVGEISDQQAHEADEWNNTKQSSLRAVRWSWVEMRSRYQGKSRFKRFDMSVVKDGHLCILCYGVPSRGKMFLKIHALQGDFNAHLNPLRGAVVELVFRAAQIYAELLGAREIWICNPVNGRLVELYESQGFTAVVKNGIVTHLFLKKA